MRSIVHGLVLLASLTTAGSASADTFRTFGLNGTLQSGGTANGSIVIDTTTGYLSSGNVNVSADNANFNFTYLFMQNTAGSPPVVDSAFFLSIVGMSITGNSLSLYLPEPLVNYQGGNLCALSTPCTGIGNQSYFGPSFGNLPIDPFVTLSATSTPEPASWMYVATGMIAVAGKLRQVGAKRRVREQA